MCKSIKKIFIKKYKKPIVINLNDNILVQEWLDTDTMCSSYICTSNVKEVYGKYASNG